MNVVVMIQGREAIPVRAIPLLTDWEVLSPDELAGALTGDYPHNTSFEKLTARRLEDGHLKDVKPRLWSNVTVRQLEALSHRIKHKKISHDDGHEQWQRESLPLLPPGVFVWKDEFEACFWSAYGPDGETEWVAVEGDFKRRKRKEFIELDFEPLVSPEFSALVMKGFEPQATYSPAPLTTAPATDTVPPAPVVTSELPDMVEHSQVKRRTWRDVAWPYVVETFKASQYSTAKDFYRALENKAGASDSPFDKGTGVNLHSLYVREISEKLALKTIQNAWAEIKASR